MFGRATIRLGIGPHSSFKCNVFVAVHFGIKGVFCKENRSNTLRTSRVYTARVPVHCTYTALYTVQHGPYAAVYTARSPFTAYRAMYTF